MRRVLIIGVDPEMPPEAGARIREGLQRDFPDHVVRVVAGLRSATEFSLPEHQPSPTTVKPTKAGE